MPGEPYGPTASMSFASPRKFHHYTAAWLPTHQSAPNRTPPALERCLAGALPEQYVKCGTECEEPPNVMARDVPIDQTPATAPVVSASLVAGQLKAQLIANRQAWHVTCAPYMTEFFSAWK